MIKKIAIASLVLLLIAAALGLNYKRELQRITFSASLFSGAEQYQNFGRMADFFPTNTMQAADTPFNFADGATISLPANFSYNGNLENTADFLQSTDTSALLVIHQGQVRFEQYWLTGGRDVNWLSMSMAKSFIATGIGIAVDAGLINIDKPITDYVPSLQGSAYDQVKIIDILQMSSGAGWNEDYSDAESDIARLGRILALGGSLDEFVATLKREHPPGTINHYNSADSQALGMLLARATGKSVNQYLEEKIWQPLGMESPGYWLVDDHGVEMAFAGVNATARDYAKLGELYRLKGKWQGKQLVAADWIEKSTTIQAPHLRPGLNKAFPLGYGYQWWIPAGTEGEFSAIGVYNQFIYINPSRDLVIVKLSANSEYGTTDSEASNKEMVTIELFREMAKNFSQP